MLNRDDTELDDVAGLILQLDRKVLFAEHRRGEDEGFEEFSAGDTVIRVVADPRLQEAGCKAADGAAAVDEVFLDATDFRHVKMGFNRFAIGPDDRERKVGFFGEEGAKC